MRLGQILIYIFINCCALQLSAFCQQSDNQIFSTIRAIKGQEMLDSASIDRFQSALVPALAEIIIEHDLVAAVRSDVYSKYRHDSSWISQSLKGGTRKLENGIAKPSTSTPRGPAFASLDQLEEQESSADKSQKLLWNSVAINESSAFSELTLNLSWTAGENAQRKSLKARLTASYPGILGMETSVAMREKLTVIEPAWLQAFQFLTIRQYGAEQDLMWFFSPGISSSRELSGSLRGDQLLDSLLSLDDLQLFSGKPEIYEPTLINSFESLVPFTSENAGLLANGSGQKDCSTFSATDKIEENPLAGLFLAPRQVYSLELKQKDPFYITGRQIIYVDSLTSLPFLKEVYSHDGKLIKSVIGTFSVVGIDGRQIGQKNNQFIVNSVIAFGSDSGITTLKTVSARICSKIPDDIPAKFFDPSGLGMDQAQTAKKG